MMLHKVTAWQLTLQPLSLRLSGAADIRDILQKTHVLFFEGFAAATSQVLCSSARGVAGCHVLLAVQTLQPHAGHCALL